MRPELAIFKRYLETSGLKWTRQRVQVAEAFLDTEGHLSAEDLYQSLTSAGEKVGLATVYRTLRVLCDCGLAGEQRFHDGTVRYEHLYGHRHHDHLICIECGKILEFSSPDIETLYADIFRQNDFVVSDHQLDLYGVCRECREAAG
jgi:Fur family ferric uptake transcriptional regulator